MCFKFGFLLHFGHFPQGHCACRLHSCLSSLDLFETRLPCMCQLGLLLTFSFFSLPNLKPIWIIIKCSYWLSPSSSFTFTEKWVLLLLSWAMHFCGELFDSEYVVLILFPFTCWWQRKGWSIMVCGCWCTAPVEGKDFSQHLLQSLRTHCGTE